MPRARTRRCLILHTMFRTLCRNTTRHILTTGTRYFEVLAPLPLSNGRIESAQLQGYCWIAANCRSLTTLFSTKPYFAAMVIATSIPLHSKSVSIGRLLGIVHTRPGTIPRVDSWHRVRHEGTLQALEYY